MENRHREQWEANAQVYSELIADKGTPHHREILNPCVEQLMGDVQGKRLLDAGCGEGYLSRHYARRGAKVVGIDISSKLIDRSKKLSEGLDIEYHQGNICDLNFIGDNSFDLVLCNLVLLNISCLEEALQEFYRVLKSKGILIFSIVHPAFNVYGPGEWELGEKDPNTGRRKGRFLKMDHYFDEKEFQIQWRTRSGDPFPQKFSFYHRTISTYIGTLMSVGFELGALQEPEPVSDNPFFSREQRIPFFLVFKARKPELELQ